MGGVVIKLCGCPALGWFVNPEEVAALPCQPHVAFKDYIE